jgi:RNA polymerase sigma-70 factor, ECF subfamily
VVVKKMASWRGIVTEPNVNPIESGSSTSLGLLERVKAKDQAAWNQLANLYAPLVDHWSCQAGLQDADAADVRQEVFLAVSRHIEEFRRDRAGDTFRGWLHRITHSKLCDYWRKKRGAKITGGPEADGQLRQQAAARPADSDETAKAEETRILYCRALELIQRDFEERTWQAFWRTAIEGQKPKDVAVDLQITPNAVYLARARVLARLREEFTGVIED